MKRKTTAIELEKALDQDSNGKSNKDEKNKKNDKENDQDDEENDTYQNNNSQIDTTVKKRKMIDGKEKNIGTTSTYNSTIKSEKSNCGSQIEHYANNFSSIIKDYIVQNRLQELVIISKENKNNLKYREYTKLKFKNHLYQLNDSVLLLNDEENQKDLICKINKIIRIEDKDKVLPLIEVQLYYQKNELHQKYNKHLGIFSQYELFLTNHYEITFVDCINGQCKILTYDEYDKLQSIDPDVFFTRSSYDRYTKTIQPPISKWPKACICKKPLNPDLQYVCCDICTIWHHLICIGMTQEEADKIDKYICSECKLLQSQQKK